MRLLKTGISSDRGAVAHRLATQQGAFAASPDDRRWGRQWPQTLRLNAQRPDADSPRLRAAGCGRGATRPQRPAIGRVAALMLHRRFAYREAPGLLP
jgi:hypothetical protein